MNFLPQVPQVPQVNKLHFYGNLASYNQAIYCFQTENSMWLFRIAKEKYGPKSIQKMPDGSYEGVPLFSCEPKIDKSYFIPTRATNYTIYKYVTISSKKKISEEIFFDQKYELVTNNEDLQICVYKFVYCEVKNSHCFLSLSKLKKSHYSFENDFLEMQFYVLDDSVSIEKNIHFSDFRWIFNRNQGNVFVDHYFINDNYQLAGNGGYLAEYDNTNRSNRWVTTSLREKLGELILPFKDAFSGQGNEPLTLQEEYMVCMTFGLIYNLKNMYRGEKNRG